MRWAVDLQLPLADGAPGGGGYAQIDPAQNGGTICHLKGFRVGQVGLQKGGVICCREDEDIYGCIMAPLKGQAPPVQLVSCILPDLFSDLLQAPVGGHKIANPLGRHGKKNLNLQSQGMGLVPPEGKTMPAEEQINRQTEGMARIRMVNPASSALRTHPAVAPIRSIHIAKT